MTALTGFSLPIPAALDTGLADLATMDLSPFQWTAIATSDLSSGAQTLVMPTITVRPLGGDRLPTPGNQVWGEVVLFPQTLALGLFVSNQVWTLHLWNTTGRSQTLTGITETGLDGVVLTADTPPSLYAPTEYREYTLTIAGTGTAEILGSIAFTFTSNAQTLTLTGTRLVLWAFEPNWRDTPVERLEWATDILTSYDGTEQRLALRQRPRRASTWLYTFEDPAKNARFNGYLWGWSQRVFALPIWTDWQYLGADLAIGSTSIPITTTARDFSAGQYVCLWHDYETFETIEIATVAANAITLSRATLQAWDAQDRVIPCRMARLNAGQSIARANAGFAEASLTWTFEIPDASSTERNGASAPTQFDGLDVLLTMPDWSDGLTDQQDRSLAMIDFGLGGVRALDRSATQSIARPFKFKFKTRTEIVNFLAWLERRRGRHFPFWMPSWTRDFEQMADIGAADTALTVRNTGYTRMQFASDERTTLIFWPATGAAPIIRTITGAAESGSALEILTLDASFGAIKKASDWRAIQFLTHCRLDQDAIELQWLNHEMAEVSLQIREVPR
jgi:hypothetical protein